MSMFHAHCSAGVWDLKTRWNKEETCRHVAFLLALGWILLFFFIFFTILLGDVEEEQYWW
jgi:hypothetical protein